VGGFFILLCVFLLFDFFRELEILAPHKCIIITLITYQSSYLPLLSKWIYLGIMTPT
jgi:hypothetical protein